VKRGDIYYLGQVQPPRGKPKDRRVVIVTEAEDFFLDNPIYVVACTSTLLREQEAEAVALRWHPRRGMSCTGFTMPTWAIPTWIDKVRPSELDRYSGYVPTDTLKEIIARLPVDPQS